MKLDNIKMIIGNTNESSSKSEEAKVNEDFFNVFQSKIEEETKEEVDIYSEESEIMEEILLELINLITVDRDENKFGNIQNENDSSNANNIKDILNGVDLESYFQGNESNMKMLESILAKKELNNENINTIIEVFKENKDIDKNIEDIKSKYENSIEKLPSKIEKVIDKLRNSELVNMDKVKNTEFVNIDKFYKNEKIQTVETNNAQYQELNILKDIAKDDKSVFMISGDKNNLRNDLSIANLDKSVPSTIRENFVAKDIVKTINYLENNNIKELKINLNPKELGAITIKLVKSDTETKISIVVAKDDVFNLVNKNIAEISKHLELLDIKVNSVSVEIKSDNQNFFSDNSNQEFKEENNRNRRNSKDEKSRSNEQIENNKITTESEENINILA